MHTSRNSTIERLEPRLLLATFVWTNRATNNFATFYGSANAALAVAIVDRALEDWGKVIVNFNRTTGNNTLNLNINATTFSGTTRGSTSSIITDAQGKPTSATVRMDDNGGGAGWYFDPAPGDVDLPDDGEFDEFVNPYMAESSTQNGADFYRTIAHEICHAVGILIGTTARINQFLTNTGVKDPNDNVSNLYAFNVNGGPIEATLSTVGGGHLYEGPAVPGHPEFPIHPGDLINSGRSVAPPPSARQLISETDVRILEQAYGYTVVTPSQVNSFYANLDTATGTLFVRGDGGDASDTIAIDVLGADIHVQVNGTTELVPISTVSSIVVSPGDGADVITIAETPPNLPVTLAASTGNDALHINSDDTGSAEVVLQATQRLGTLQIGTGGRLDVRDHAVVLDYADATPLASVRSHLASGFNAGSWNGEGIGTSSGDPTTFSLGYAEASELFTTFPATFEGEEIDGSTVLIRFTRYGDTDLDGLVNLADFNRLANNFGAPGAWSAGDLNYDAAVNLGDFNLLANNFGLAGVIPRVSGGMTRRLSPVGKVFSAPPELDPGRDFWGDLPPVE